jgi:CDP-diacylglycerol--glycerol-3-phosphate 3-phosphatidyltransferase
MARPKPFSLLPHRAPKQILDPIVGVLARTGVSPNHISLFGFAGNVGAGVLAARGDFIWAGLAMLFFSALDMLDGALARATGRATPFGAVLDSALDRLSEAAVLGGLTYYFVERGQTEEVVLCFTAITASILVSYVRAQTAAQGLQMRDGLFTRAERVILLAAVLMIDQVRIGLWILAVLAMVTALQRIYVAWDGFRENASPAEPVPPQEEET